VPTLEEYARRSLIEGDTNEALIVLAALGRHPSKEDLIRCGRAALGRGSMEDALLAFETAGVNPDPADLIQHGNKCSSYHRDSEAASGQLLACLAARGTLIPKRESPETHE